MNKEFNLLDLKRKQEVQEKRKAVSRRQMILQKMNEFAEAHPSYKHLFDHTAIDSRYSEGDRNNLSPDTNRTWYGLARYLDAEGKEVEFYRLEALCDCLCGCGTRRGWLSVFDFESLPEALTIGEFIKTKGNYELCSYPEGRIREVSEKYRKSKFFDLQVNFGGEGYGKYSEACGFEIPHELGKGLYEKLTAWRPSLRVQVKNLQ